MMMSSDPRPRDANKTDNPMQIEGIESTPTQNLPSIPALPVVHDASATVLSVPLNPTSTSRYPQHSVFTRSQKRYIALLISLIGSFSVISQFIFFPAITLIALDLHTSVSKINLTVTAYMAIEAVAPAIMGDAADMLGRRPVILICLLVYWASNVGCALVQTWEGLFGLKILQAVGTSGVFSICMGIVADISTPAERGVYVGILVFGMLFMATIGPVFGGIIAYYSGWRWIFWFLSILSGCSFTATLLTLPETARNLVQDGSIKPPRTSSLPFPQLFPLPWNRLPSSAVAQSPRRKFYMPNPLNSFRLMQRKDRCLLIVNAGICYVTEQSLTITWSSIFIAKYGISNLDAGLIYLSPGIGFGIGGLLASWLTDREYRMVARKYGLKVERARSDDLSNFPIEEARLRNSIWPLLILAACFVGIGWLIEKKVHMSLPLILALVAGVFFQVTFNFSYALLVDISQSAPASAQAAYNGTRCAFTAIALAVVQPIIGQIGVGWTYTGLGLLNVGCAAGYWVNLRYGAAWRLGKGNLRTWEECAVGTIAENQEANGDILKMKKIEEMKNADEVEIP